MDSAVDVDRWQGLYRREFPRVYRALVAALFDREAALDALHDAFLEGLRRPPRDERNLTGWLYRVALRKARRGLRRSARNIELRAGDALADDEGRTLDRLEVGRLLMMLSARQREVVVAHYYLGLRHDEVASLLGIRPGTVAATISQAIARMRSATHA